MKLYFHGGAGAVTGANYLLESVATSRELGHTTRVLIDCGLSQGESFSEKANWDPFPYDPKTIDALLVTHAHIDHTGKIPKLVRDGFASKIYSTAPTKDFAEQLLLDSQHLLLRESESKGLAMLYDAGDINEAMKHWQKIGYHEKLKVGSFEIAFYDAGHILGSAFIEITETEGPDAGKKIVFSGDLGNVPAPLVKDTELISGADYALIESAYGNRVHQDPESRRDILEDTIEETVKSNGVLLIPAFAMERTQDLLFELNDLVEHGKIPPVPIFVDSPLAIKLTGIYQKYVHDPHFVDDEAIRLLHNGDAIFDFPRLNLALTTEQSKEINTVHPPKVIIAGSGMSHGGRILHHEMRYLPDPNTTILFVGYQTSGSLGRRILDGDSAVSIFGETIPVRCKVRSISGYSAHADQPLLLKWISPMKDTLKKLFIVQGDEEEMIPLSKKVQDELAVNAIVPKMGEMYEL